ncbi:MAG: bifunctional diaminohydroxyphosphoribosylaminopyrimidine deaminase/5-amino-6-(5-phosphoribosylamino)uracil reductase RibD [Candidatus Zixiibacteriota bacterium]
MVVNDDINYMNVALELAQKGRGLTSPNPIVGSVIIKNGKIIGRGYHKKAGGPHAEIYALKEAGENARGATLYVTLEPCCHHGRTGPCTEAIKSAKIKRVVLAMKDPNQLVNGKGIVCLKKAGIEIKAGVLKNEAKKINEIYLKNIETGMPFVTLKIAQTLDGRIATASGNSQWISGLKSRKYAHQLRADYDAVLIGGGTVRTDNPQMTVRHIKGKNPYRLILSRTLIPDNKLNLFQNNQDAKTILVTSRAVSERIYKMNKVTDNLIIWDVKLDGNRLSPIDLLQKASDFGIKSILIEGGSGVATSFIKAGLIDKYYISISPKIIGRGIETISDLGIQEIASAIEFKEFQFHTSFAPDIIFEGYPIKKVEK